MKRTNDLRLPAEITEEFLKRNSFLAIRLLLMFTSYLDEFQENFSAEIKARVLGATGRF